MHFAPVLWIFWFLSTTVAGRGHGSTNDDLSEGQVVKLVQRSMGTTIRAIFLGYTKDKEKSLLQFVQFGQDLPFIVQKADRAKFREFFGTVMMRDHDGKHHMLAGIIDLKIQYKPLKAKGILIPDEKVILNTDGMALLKETLSVALVKAALTYDHPVALGHTNIPKRGRVVWVSSEKMYEDPDHRYHFAIFLGLADPQHGSALPKLKIAQIMMNLPIPIPHDNRADFNFYFPITWWFREPKILLSGDIDLVIHEMNPEDIYIPSIRIFLDPKQVDRLERHMVGLTEYPVIEPGRSSSLPPKRVPFEVSQHGYTNAGHSDESGSEDRQTSGTKLTRPKSAGQIVN